MRRWLPELAVRRPVTVLMGFLALIVMGVIAFLDIPLQMMPSGFNPPYMWVWVPYDDSTPQETDAQIVAPIEATLATVPGIKELGSRASADHASFNLEFYQSVDLDEAYNAVADRMERALPELPDDVRYYGIYRFDPSDEPIVWAGVSIGKELEDPYYLMTEVVQRRLERVPGVAKVDVWGVDEKLVFIEFDREALFAHGVSLYQLMGKLSSDNFQLASGRITDEGQVRYVRSLARYEDIDAIKRTPVAPGVVLEDVADVRYRVSKSASINRINGEEAAALAINKESTANTVEVANAVQAAFDELSADPRLSAMEFFTFFSQGELIEESIDNLTATALQGGLFAVLILFVFLREIRVTLLIAASIPMSLMITVTVLYFTGGTLNLLSLMGLMIAVGMVVDNAIVVVETIYRRRQEGLDRIEAAVDGTAEVNLAIVLSTMTTMVVFLPLILMSEDAMFSFFMGSLGFPVVFALAASLLVALIFTPLTTAYMKRGQVKGDPGWIVWLSARYEQGLRWMLTRRFDTFVGLLGVLILTFVVPVKAVGCTDQASGNLNDFTLRFQVPGTFSYPERVEVIDTIEGVLDDHAAEWGLRVYRTRMRDTSNYGRTYVYIHDDGPMELDDVREAALEAMPELPGVRVWSGYGGSSSKTANTISLSLEGEDSDTLMRLADEVLRRVRDAPGVLAVENALDEESSEELRVHVDRDAAARYGIDATTVGRTLAFAMRGRELPELYMDDQEVTVYARFSYEDRQDVDTLRDFPLFSPLTGAQVPLRAVTDVEVARGFGDISRTDRVTSLPLTVEFEEDIDMPDAYASIETALSDMAFPRGYGWSKGRRFDEQVENDSARNMALLLSVTFVFLLMGVLFESFLLPMSIITTIPMALIGVYWTLYLSDTPLDVMGGVGLVILVGVVVNNGIVLVDLVTQLRQQGVDRIEALLLAGQRRMRPILMTALTTIFGLLPMALGTSTFIGIPYAPLGRVVAGGIGAATLLTLFFVPYLYTVLDDLRAVAGRALRYAVSSGWSAAEGK
ncbi:MAG: efflux RND transporter permease subunit [Alphaproteobacteria bacterium]|nr:efflux RND transporter permease subunit [Alphaproteobacteria bacterium]